jgi:hypothetical protein
VLRKCQHGSGRRRCARPPPADRLRRRAATLIQGVARDQPAINARFSPSAPTPTRGRIKPGHIHRRNMSVLSKLAQSDTGPVLCRLRGGVVGRGWRPVRHDRLRAGLGCGLWAAGSGSYRVRCRWHSHVSRRTRDRPVTHLIGHDGSTSQRARLIHARSGQRVARSPHHWHSPLMTTTRAEALTTTRCFTDRPSCRPACGKRANNAPGVEQSRTWPAVARKQTDHVEDSASGAINPGPGACLTQPSAVSSSPKARSTPG